MIRRFFERLKRITSMPVPDSYDPSLHYNCFIESVTAEDRQAVYKELCRMGKMEASHYLPNGRLQLSLTRFSAGIDAINAVAKNKVIVAGLSKARLIELMTKNPDMEATFLLNTNDPDIKHAERIHLTQIVVDSEDAFRNGVKYHEKRQYQQAIKCYDDAIRIEPEDVRAWHNKIMALAQDGKHQEAIKVADEALGRYPNVGFLWEAKGRILGELGQLLDSGKCMSKACELDPDIAKKHTGQIDQRMDNRLQVLMDACRKEGKNPETDVDFWFSNFAKYTNSGNVEEAWICLQMAATVKPDYFVMSDESGMALLPPGNILLSKELLPEDAKVERLRDFFQRMTALAMRKRV